MFDFEKLDVYQVTKDLNKKVYLFLKNNKEMDPYLLDQWKRASFSALLNLSEGTGRMQTKDKQHFITIARGSVFEAVAIIDLLKDAGEIEQEAFDEMYAGYEQISKMLLGMYRSYER